jgi:hypothetical protein
MYTTGQLGNRQADMTCCCSGTDWTLTASAGDSPRHATPRLASHQEDTDVGVKHEHWRRQNERSWIGMPSASAMKSAKAVRPEVKSRDSQSNRPALNAWSAGRSPAVR